MRVKSGLIGLAILVAGAASVAGADTLGLLQSIDDFIVGRKPTNLPNIVPPAPTGTAKPATTLEKAASVNGALYAVVAPIYKANGGTTSYLRLFNGGAAAAVISVTIVGEPSGTTFGTANVTLNSRAGTQLSITDLTNLAAPGVTVATDISYALYLQSAEATAGYQHVVYNTDNKFFENVSVCKTLLNTAIAGVANSLVLTNIHTSLFGNNYPSQVEIHNYWNAPIVYKATIIDGQTGNVKGQVNIPTAANTSYSFPFSYFENAVGWIPVGGQLYGNLVLTDTSGAAPAAVVGQSIINNAALSGATVNMSTACAINSTTAAGGGSGGVFGGGGISY